MPTSYPTPVGANPTGAPIQPGQNLDNPITPGNTQSTTLAQDQAKAANQGKPGYDIVGNPIATQSTTTLSSNKTADVSNIQNKTNQLSQTGVTTDPTTGVATNADNSVYTPGADNTPTEAPANGVSNGGYVGDVYYPPGATLPTDSTGSYQGTTAYSPTDVSILNNLNNEKSQNDAVTSSIISSIQNQYQQFIQQQQQTNTSQNEGEQNILLRNGSLQHTGSGQNVLSATVSYGISQLADLNNKEQMAILSAQQAGQNQDFQLQDKINKEISDIRDTKVAAATKLNDQIAAQNQKLSDQKMQATKDTAIATIVSSGISDPAQILSKLQAQGDTTISLADIKSSLSTLQPDAQAIVEIMKDASSNGAPPDVLTAIGQAKTTSDAIAASKSYLQTATGQLGDYLQYERTAQANGLVPEDYGTWKIKDDAQTAKEKESEAYGTAFATAQGKAAGTPTSTTLGATSPVESPQGITYNAPASIAPYVSFASNGVKYADLSGFAGTPTEKNQAVQDAQAAGYKVITNKNTALDVQNITDANAKLDDMQKAFSSITSDSATQRNLYGAAITTMAKELQTNPNVVASGIYQDAALDILKAMSGVQGFRGGASIVQQVKDTFPSATDTTDVANAKINTIKSLISDRENALVGSPSATDQSLITQKNNENNLTTNLTSVKTSNPKLYTAASSMFLATNPDTGQPYSAADILQAFPELNTK